MARQKDFEFHFHINRRHYDSWSHPALNFYPPSCACASSVCRRLIPAWLLATFFLLSALASIFLEQHQPIPTAIHHDEPTTAPRNAGPTPHQSLQHRECTAAINGEEIPNALGLPLLRICTTRGIRYNDGFGDELRGVAPEFTRALNARAIMSNRIPEIDSSEETPYCIWHPQVANEDTYRQLVSRYPSMAYHVGRACAVAGYTALYKELDILPDTHIAEEAREAENTEIYEAIMTDPVKYSVMNDYDRTIDEHPKPAHLNGDTAVCSSLDIKQRFSNAYVPKDDDDDDLGFGLFDDKGFRDNTFNLTEDMSIDVRDTEYEDGVFQRQSRASNSVLIDLMTSPLPLDLPTVDKDFLNNMAAYYGDIERYSRLRRPFRPQDSEHDSYVRGVYHNTMFAVWWPKQDPAITPHRVIDAIDARFIMNNVLSRISSITKSQPYLIWYPTIASASAYRKLASLVPKMLPQILRACIVRNYAELFDELVTDYVPDDGVIAEAAASKNAHYKEVLDARVKTVGTTEAAWHWMRQTCGAKHFSSDRLYKDIRSGNPGWVGAFDGIHYNGFLCNDTSEIELMMCLPEEWQIPVNDDDYERTLEYVNWPPGMSSNSSTSE